MEAVVRYCAGAPPPQLSYRSMSSLAPFLLLLGAWVGISQPQPAMDWRAKAAEARRHQDFAAAADAYRKLLESDPDNPQLLTNLGMMLSLAARHAEALAPLDRALERDPDSVPAHLFSGLSLLGLGRAREALPHLERARKGDPAGALPALGLARALSALGEFRRANDEFDAAAGRDPDNPEIWAGLGATYASVANQAAAHIAALHPTAAAASDARQAAGHYKTRPHWLAAEAGQKRMPDDLTLLIRFMRSSLDLAIASHQRAVDLAPGSAVYRMMLGASLLTAGRNAEAAAQYERAVAIRPDSAEGWLALAIAHRMDGADDRARVPLERALRLNPDSAEANGVMGDLLAGEGEFDKARPYLEKALARSPGLAPAHAALSKGYVAQSRFDLALEEIRKALPYDRDGAYYYQMSLVLRHLGRVGDAEAALDQFRARRGLRGGTPAREEGPAANQRPAP